MFIDSWLRRQNLAKRKSPGSGCGFDLRPSIAARRIGVLAILVCGAPGGIGAQQAGHEEIQLLRQAIREQRVVLDDQSRKLNELVSRLDRLESKAVVAEPAKTTAVVEPAPAPPAPARTREAVIVRDAVGDLNSGQILSGMFPGSIQLPGPRGVSLGFGGFVKTLGFYDTNAEGREAVFLPSTLGSIRDDRDGGSSLTAELTRLNVDVRGAAGNNKFRGYLEWDMSGDSYKWRHGYLTWDNASNQILAGKYWSNFMDLQILPEGLGEPTVSGAIFTRQAQFRFTRRMERGVSFTAALEDPASSDIIASEAVPTRTAVPDFTTTLTVQGQKAHLMLGGLVRRLTVDPNGNKDLGANGWGIHAGSHVNLGRDKLTASYVFGSGLGRYLLGVVPSAGAFVDLDNRVLATRNAFGATATYRHQWTENCRSTGGGGYASAETDARQPDGAFRASAFGMANYMCTVHRYLTMGVEYNFGKRWNRVGALDSSRFMFGMQLF